jgi:hypothetical protein
MALAAIAAFRRCSDSRVTRMSGRKNPGCSLVQIRPLQSIVLSCQRVPDTLQPSEFLGEFVQAYGWARLPVTPLNLFQVSCGELF